MDFLRVEGKPHWVLHVRGICLGWIEKAEDPSDGEVLDVHWREEVGPMMNDDEAHWIVSECG